LAAGDQDAWYAATAWWCRTRSGLANPPAAADLQCGHGWAAQYRRAARSSADRERPISSRIRWAAARRAIRAAAYPDAGGHLLLVAPIGLED